MDWWVDLLTTYAHHSELQALTTLSLISTIHSSPQHLLSLFQPAVSSPAVPWQRLLTVETFQFHALRCYLQSLPWRTQLSTNNCLPGWRPFHTNLLVFSSQADSQLTTTTWQKTGSRQLYSLKLLDTDHIENTRFHCCSQIVAAA
jgi:hypothetical protein